MYKLTRLVTLAEAADREPPIAALRALVATHRPLYALVAPTLEGSWFGGDLILHLQFDSAVARAACDAAIAAWLTTPAVASSEAVFYRGTADGVHAPGLRNGVYRALLLRIDDGVDVATIRRFEDETRQMPRHIPAILNWQLSRVENASGTQRWTHVWEQDFADIGGLLGPYMLSPYHWAHIDRWFDPECPDRIVDAHICHSFCMAAQGVLPG